MPLLPLPPIGRLSPLASRLLLDQTVAVSVLAAALGGGLLLLPAARREAAPAPRAARSLAWLPFAGLLFVAALLVCNQVLVGVHIQVAYHGDPAFITRYFGPGWFELPRGGPLADLIARLAHALPPSLSGREGLLSYTLLRVQAVLELPFTLCAYLSVCGLVAPWLVPALLRGPLFPAAALSFTFTFCLIEARLWNPYTVSDIRARGLCCAAVLLLWPILRRAVPPTSIPPVSPHWRPGGAALLLGYAGAGAVCVLVLGLYDATLLYNLGHLPRYLPLLAAAVAVAVLSLALSSRLQPRAPSPAVQTVASLLCAFALLFFVPSLAIRYCGARPSAALGGLATFALALPAGLLLSVRGLRAQGGSFALALPGLAAFASVGGALCAAAFTGRLGFVSGAPILEARLLLCAALALIPGTAAAWAVDAVVTAAARPLRRDPAGAAAPPPPPRAAR